MFRKLDFRSPDLYAGMQPGEIWKMYVADVDQGIEAEFHPDRARPFVQLRTPSEGFGSMVDRKPDSGV